AWEEMLLSGTPRLEKHVELLCSCKRVDKATAARFLGFIEGRLGVRMPKWWEECVADAYRFEDTGPVFPADPSERPNHEIKNPYLALPRGISRTIDKGRTTLRSGKDEIQLPPVIVEDYLEGQHNLAVLIDRDVCLLAPYGHFGHSYPVVCIDRQSGK